MIELKLFFALVSYYFVMFSTPGPNNAMLTASGIKFGFKRTLPHAFGIPFGHIIQITLVCFGLGALFQKNPSIELACKLWGAKESVLKSVGDKNLNYREDIQIENIKG